MNLARKGWGRIFSPSVYAKISTGISLPLKLASDMGQSGRDSGRALGEGRYGKDAGTFSSRAGLMSKAQRSRQMEVYKPCSARG